MVKKTDIKDAYVEIANRLSRKVDGMSIENISKYLKVDDADDGVVTRRLIEKYGLDENEPITAINGKYKGKDMNEVLIERLDSAHFKNIIATNMTNMTMEKIREQLYLIKYMPQLDKVLDDMVKLVMSPNTQSRKRIDVEILNKDIIKESEIDVIFQKKDLEDKIFEGMRKAFIHGSGLVYVYPYKRLATDILDLFKRTNVTGGAQQPYFKESMDFETDSTKINRLRSIPKSDFKKMLRNIDILDNSNKFFSESPDLVKSKIKTDSDYRKDYVKTTYFSNNHITGNCVSNFNLFLEADTPIGPNFNTFGGMPQQKEKYSNRYLNQLNGCHVELLDMEKCIPLYVNDILIGAYYVENNVYNDYLNKNNGIEKNREKLRDPLGFRATLDLSLKETIASLLKEEMDEKFLLNNKHVLNSINMIITDISNKSEPFKIKFIPAEYLVEFKNYHRASQLNIVDALAHYWIYLSKNYIFRKLFYERDKIITKTIVDYDDDVRGQAYRTMNALENLVPSPADILNLRKMYTGLINSHRIIAPKSKNGRESFEFERLEGQQTGDKDMEDLIKWENIITGLIGFNLSAYDPSAQTDYAIKAVIADENKADMIIGYQNHFKKPLNDLLVKIFQYEIDETISHTDFEAAFPEQRTLKQQIFSDALAKVSEKIDYIIAAYVGDDGDPGVKAFLKKELFKKYASIYVDTDDIEKLIKRYGLEKKDKPTDNQ